MLTVVFFTGTLFYLDWQLPLIALLVAPSSVVFTRIFSRLVLERDSGYARLYRLHRGEARAKDPAL